MTPIRSHWNIRLLCHLIGWSTGIIGCTNGKPNLRSLNLTSPSFELVQSQKTTTELISNSNGEFEFSIRCQADLSTLEVSATTSQGPWSLLATLECKNGLASVIYIPQAGITDEIFLRTRGTWGTSAPQKVRLLFRNTVDLTNVPAGRSRQTSFKIQVTGDSLVAYRFSFGSPDVLNCGDTNSYSKEFPLKEKIDSAELNYPSLPDGPYRLCLITKSNLGTWSRFDLAFFKDWIKDTTPPKVRLVAVNGQNFEEPPTKFQSNKDTPVLDLAADNEEGSLISLSKNPTCSTLILSQPIKANKASLIVPGGTLEQGLNSIYIKSKDLAGNESSCLRLLEYNLDSIAPHILSVSGFTNRIYFAGEILSFDVNLSEEIQWNHALGDPALELILGGIIKKALYVDSKSSASKLHFEYVVAAGDNDADGLVLQSPLTQEKGNPLADLYGNLLTREFLPPNTSGMIIDTTNPVISSVTAFTADQWIRTGDDIAFTVVFSEACKFNDASNLELPFTLGTSTLLASCKKPTAPTNTLACKYKVLVDQLDIDGVSIIAENLRLNGKISDLSNQVANLTLPVMTFTSVLVDSVAPPLENLNLLDGTLSSSLSATPPLSWNSVADPGSGVASYLFQVIDDTEKIILSKSYSSAQSNLVIGGLHLLDLTDDSKQFRTYTTKLTVKDAAGNSSSIQGDGWKVLQFSHGPELALAESSPLSSATMTLSKDGKRLLVGLPQLNKVKIYRYNTASRDWTFSGELNDAPSEKSHFGTALGIFKLSAPSAYLYAIGAPGDGVEQAGSVFLYKDTGTKILSRPKIESTSPSPTDHFGNSLDFIDNQLFIGSPGFSTETKSSVGQVLALLCEGTEGECKSTEGTAPYNEVARGQSENQRLGDLLSATKQNGVSTLYTSTDGIRLARYTYDSTLFVWSQAHCDTHLYCDLWTEGSPKLSTLDAQEQVIVASNGTAAAKISLNGQDFTTLKNTQGGAIGPIAVVSDPNTDLSLNLGIFILAFDASSSSVLIYKTGPTDYFLKQTEQGLSDFSMGAFSGSGSKLMMVSPQSGTIFSLN